MRGAIGLYLSVAVTYLLVRVRAVFASFWWTVHEAAVMHDREDMSPGVNGGTLLIVWVLFLFAHTVDAVLWPWTAYLFARRRLRGGGP
jgi:hypothetical protein